MKTYKNKNSYTEQVQKKYIITEEQLGKITGLGELFQDAFGDDLKEYKEEDTWSDLVRLAKKYQDEIPNHLELKLLFEDKNIPQQSMSRAVKDRFSELETQVERLYDMIEFASERDLKMSLKGDVIEFKKR